jgi:hypothetical protein
VRVRFVPTYSWIRTPDGWRPIYHGVKRCFADDRGPVAPAPFCPRMSDGALADPEGLEDE